MVKTFTEKRMEKLLQEERELLLSEVKTAVEKKKEFMPKVDY